MGFGRARSVWGSGGAKNNSGGTMKFPHRVLRTVCISAALFAVAGAATAATNYRVESLPYFTGIFDTVEAIGPSGIAVGSGVSSDYPDTAVIWDEAGNVSGITNLQPAVDINASGQILLGNWIVSPDGTYTRVEVPFNFSTLTAINDAAQVAGYAWKGYSGGVHSYGAFVWHNSVTTELPALPNGGSTFSTEINNQGVVVGHAINAAGEMRAVMWKDGAIIDLGTLPGGLYTAATGINDLGQIVVVSAGRGFLWDNGAINKLTGFASDVSVYPRAINNAGQVIGSTSKSYLRSSAFLWSNGTVRDLTPVMGDTGSGCVAIDINDAGQIVGSCGTRNIRLTPAAAATDVGVELIASASSATQGSPISYTIKVSNVGALPASGVTLTDVLPAHVTFVSAVPSQGSCSASLPLACALGDLASDAVATVELTVIPTAAGGMSNSASITTNEVDANALNNTATHGVTVNAVVISADLSVTISGPTTAKPRTNITYTMTVKNNGPAEAKTVSLTNTLAANLYFVSSSTTQGSCGGTTCSLGTLASGATATVKFTVRPLLRGSYTSRSSLTFGGTDNNTTNNTATITTVVK